MVLPTTGNDKFPEGFLEGLSGFALVSWRFPECLDRVCKGFPLVFWGLRGRITTLQELCLPSLNRSDRHVLFSL